MRNLVINVLEILFLGSLKYLERVNLSKIMDSDMMKMATL